MIPHKDFQVRDSQLKIPHKDFQVRDSQLKIPHKDFQVRDSQVKISPKVDHRRDNSQLKIPHKDFQVRDSQVKISPKANHRRDNPRVKMTTKQESNRVKIMIKPEDNQVKMTTKQKHNQVTATKQKLVPINPDCTELDIENVTASGFESDPSDYHPPGDAIDGELTTWWSHNGNDPWIEISLVESNPVCGVAVTWNKGDERDYSFEIGISEDGNNFEKVFEGTNDNESTEQEIYPFDQEVNGKYIKLTITDTSSNDGWTSIQEIDALGLTEP